MVQSDVCEVEWELSRRGLRAPAHGGNLGYFA